MDAKKERVIAYAALIALFVVGVVAYAAFKVEAKEPPVRVLFSGNGGYVVFGHTAHDAEAYGAPSCTDCHHTGEMNPKVAGECTDCHEDPEDYPKEDFDHQAHAVDFGLSCEDCHTETYPEGTPLPSCAECHTKEGTSYAQKAMDAFHDQCINCHKDEGKGPVKCSECHFQ